MKYSFKTDIAVLMVFFCRDDKFKQVFEQVKKARPSKLYLYQDGARENKPNDKIGIEKCREICSDENIDWECEVHRFYQEKNFGCDPSGYIAHKWLFENEEMGIVLEDDVVPAQDFFPFAKELLEKYKDDERVAIICGMNNYDVTKDVDSSYFFSKRGSIWGWASWKRFLDLWDGEYTWFNDETAREKIKAYCDNGMNYDDLMKIIGRHVSAGKPYFESVMFAAAAQNNMLNIVPKYNMISNIGVDADATHAAADIRLLPKRTQKLMYKKVYDIKFPLVHPEKVEPNRKFDRKYKRTLLTTFFMRAEALCRKIIYGRKK